MRSGAARILDDSRVLSDDPREHSELLTRFAVQANAGNEAAMNIVVNCMSRLVFRLSETYFWKWSTHLPAHASFDNVFNAGLEGLVIGTGKFDPERGTVLTTSATHWIRTKVQREIYAQCGSARIPEHVLQGGLDPGSPLVASSTSSLDFRYEEDGPSLGDTIPAEDETLEEAGQRAALEKIVALLRTLDDKMPKVAEYLERGYADREIARLTGLTSKRVAELRGQAEQLLRSHGYG